MQLKNNSKRLQIATLFMIISVIMDAIGVPISIVGIMFLGNLESGNYSQEWLQQFDQIEVIYSSAYLVDFAVTIIVFVMWFRRAYFNVWRFAISPPRFTEGWAAGAWFVPILSLFRPVQIMREIWLESVAFLRQHSPVVPPADIQGSISLWWGTWIAGSLISNASARMTLRDEGLDTLATSYYMDLVSSVCLIVSGIVLLKIMKSYGQLEDELQVIETSSVEDSIFYNNALPEKGAE